MFFNTLFLLGYLLPYVGFLVVFAIWWPSRNDQRFSSIPWIFASKAITLILSLLMPKIAAFFPDSSAKPTSEWIITLSICVALQLVITYIQSFVIAWMIGVNLAFLMQETSPVSRMQRFFSQQHAHQRKLGLILLIISLVPVIFMIAQCILGYPPHFTK